VRQRPDDARRSAVEYSLTNQRRVTCTSVAFLEPFWSLLSLSTLCAGCEVPGTNDDAGRRGTLRQRRGRHCGYVGLVGGPCR